MSIRLLSIAAVVAALLADPLLVGQGSPASGQSQSGTVAITNVAVIPMDRERVLANQTVLIESGRITSVGPTRSTTPAGATVIVWP